MEQRYHNRHNNRGNRKPPPKRFKIKVFDTRKGSKPRSFIHEGLRYWEVEYIRFHPFLKVKILEVT